MKVRVWRPSNRPDDRYRSPYHVDHDIQQLQDVTYSNGYLIVKAERQPWDRDGKQHPKAVYAPGQWTNYEILTERPL